MGLFGFMREAGKKLYGDDQNTDQESANRSASSAITAYIQSLQLPVTNLVVEINQATQTARVSGTVPNQEIREKVILACGNVQGISTVEDRLVLAVTESTELPAAEAVIGSGAQFHTVESGDTLSKIAKKYYGDVNAYTVIFEANKPMLTDPDKIYPGQVLRVPPVS